MLKLLALTPDGLSIYRPAAAVKSGRRSLFPDDAVRVTLSHKPTLSDVQKHLDDYRKGRANQSKSIAHQLSGLDVENASLLAAGPPKLASLYLHYRTALDYEKSRQYVHSLNGALTATRDMAAAEDEPLPEDMQRLIERYDLPAPPADETDPEGA